MLWNTLEKVLVKGTSFVIGIILARILSPNDYGLLGMLAIVIALSQIFIESGIAKALIQKQNCNDVDYSTAFYSNIGIAVCIYIIIYFSAPIISDFYEEPILKSLLRVLSINFVLGAFNIVHRTKLMVQVDFKSLAQINFIGTIVGGGIGIVVAYSNVGVWALVTQTICTTFVMFCLFPFYSKWKPTYTFSVKSFKSLFGYGYKLLISGIVAVIFENISTICIGKIYRDSQLGFYTRAVQFSSLISTVLFEVIGTVTFPVLSKLQNEKERMLLLYKQSLSYSLIITAPIMIMIAMLSRPLVEVLLTEKWLPCVPLLQILCIARLFTPLSAINMNMLNAIGRSDLYMKVDCSKIPLSIITLSVTIPFGVQAIVWGELINTFICFFINAYYPGRIFGYTAWQQIKDWRYILLSLLMMCGGLQILIQLFTNPWVQLIGGAIIAIVIYVMSCLIFNIISIQNLKLIGFTDGKRT